MPTGKKTAKSVSRKRKRTTKGIRKSSKTKKSKTKRKAKTRKRYASTKSTKSTKSKSKSTIRKKKTGYRYSLPLDVCSLGSCTHEKCHHLKFIKHLWFHHYKNGIMFHASLLPWQRVHSTHTYGIICGDTDFIINEPYLDHRGRVRFCNLRIELKAGGGTLTNVEKDVIRKLIEKGNDLVGVCYGVNACKALLKAYLNGEPESVLEELCWKGKTKKSHVMG